MARKTITVRIEATSKHLKLSWLIFSGCFWLSLLVLFTLFYDEKHYYVELRKQIAGYGMLTGFIGVLITKWIIWWNHA